MEKDVLEGEAEVGMSTLITMLVIPAADHDPLRLATSDCIVELLEDAVGETFDTLWLPTSVELSVLLWFNDCWRELELPFNARATDLWHQLGAPADVDLFGNVVVSGPKDAEGDTLSVPRYMIEAMETA